MVSMEMQTAGGTSGYGGGRRSPVGIGGAIAVHVVVVIAFLLMPKEVFKPFDGGTITARPIPLLPPPPENPPPPDAKKTRAETPNPRSTATDPTIILPPTDWTIKGGDPVTFDNGTGKGPDIVAPPIDPPHAPLYVEPGIDPRAQASFQPEYPGAMIRQQLEGRVTVRVTIGPDGRVTAIERLSATDEAFWIATRRQALRKWRFRPATRDGVAVSGTKIMTVHFKLENR